MKNPTILTTNLIAAATLLLSLGGCTKKANIGTMVTPEDCFRPLEQGIYNKFEVTSREQFSAKLRDWLKATRAERKHLKESGGGSGSLSIGIVSIGGSGGASMDRLEALDQEFERNQNYLVDDSSMLSISQMTVDPVLIENYYRALAQLMHQSGPALELKREYANSSSSTVSYRVMVASDGDEPQAAKVKALVVTGGKIEAASVAAGQTITSGKPFHIVVRRNALERGGMEETRIFLNTDLGSVVKLEKGVEPTPVIASPDKPREPVVPPKPIAAKLLVFGTPSSKDKLYIVTGSPAFNMEKSGIVGKYIAQCCQGPDQILALPYKFLDGKQGSKPFQMGKYTVKNVTEAIRHEKISIQPSTQGLPAVPERAPERMDDEIWWIADVEYLPNA